MKLHFLLKNVQTALVNLGDKFFIKSILNLIRMSDLKDKEKGQKATLNLVTKELYLRLVN